jgi:murein DD-endopeptidase MepM/ murein hydrolase activator NlpD
MGGKVFAYFFLIFGVIVLADWLVTGLRNLAGNFAPLNYRNSGLAEIDFNFFSTKESRNYISQGYGSTYFSLFNYGDRWHNGIDIAAKYGAPVLAAVSGEVIATGDQDKFCYQRGFGKFVAVKNDGLGLVLFYAHLGTIDVRAGARVGKENKIGAVGASGYETGTHLHFSVFDANGFRMENKNGCGPNPTGRDLNPMLYMDEFRTSRAAASLSVS